MSMFFITDRASGTGKRFRQIERRVKECLGAQQALANRYGFSSFRRSPWTAFGGMRSCADFHAPPDSKLWGRSAYPGEYFPKRNSSGGKAIANEIERLPVITHEELNACVGFDGGVLGSIGFDFGHKDLYGFTADESWNLTPPDDCREVTASDYRKLFG